MRKKGRNGQQPRECECSPFATTPEPFVYTGHLGKPSFQIGLGQEEERERTGKDMKVGRDYVAETAHIGKV